MPIKFTIDPGHTTNYNTGIIPGYFEGNMNFKLAGYLKTALEQYEGFTAVLTKDTLASNPSLDIRGRFAINNGSQVFLSLHSNAASAESATGVVLIRSLARPGSEHLGELLGSAVANCIGTNFRGVSTRVYPDTANTDYYGVLRASVRNNTSVVYSYILEHGFHTNKKECTWLTDDNHLRQLADREAAVFATYFSAARKTTTVISDTTMPFSIKKGGYYQFRLTADIKPVFEAGSSGTFKIEFVRQTGRDYFFKVTAIGQPKQASGFYINHAKTPTVVITIY